MMTPPKKYKADVKQKKLPWTNELICKLIEFYHRNPCLWDPKECKNNTKRKLVLHDFLVENNLPDEFTTDDLKEKFRNLRTTFCANYVRAKRKRQGDRKDYLYSPSWPYYKKLMFLKDNVTEEDVSQAYASNSFIFSTPGAAELSPSHQDSALESFLKMHSDVKDEAIPMEESNYLNGVEENGVCSQTDDTSTKSSTPNFNRVLRLKSSGKKQLTSTTSFSESLKLEDHFGKYVAAQLREMDVRSGDLAQAEIVQVLLKHKYGLTATAFDTYGGSAIGSHGQGDGEASTSNAFASPSCIKFDGSC